MKEKRRKCMRTGKYISCSNCKKMIMRWLECGIQSWQSDRTAITVLVLVVIVNVSRFCICTFASPPPIHSNLSGAENGFQRQWAIDTIVTMCCHSRLLQYKNASKTGIENGNKRKKRIDNLNPIEVEYCCCWCCCCCCWCTTIIIGRT